MIEQVAMVTGAISGLRRATAAALARAAAAVALVARSATDLDDVADELSPYGRPHTSPCDPADAAGLADAVARALAQLGPVRVLSAPLRRGPDGPVAHFALPDPGARFDSC